MQLEGVGVAYERDADASPSDWADKVADSPCPKVTSGACSPVAAGGAVKLRDALGACVSVVPGSGATGPPLQAEVARRVTAKRPAVVAAGIRVRSLLGVFIVYLHLNTR